MASSSLTQRARSLFRYGKELNPVRDWFVIIAVFAILLGVSIGWNTITFIRLTRAEALDGTADAATAGASATEIHAVFERRAVEEQKYRNEYRFVDPSRSGG